MKKNKKTKLIKTIGIFLILSGLSLLIFTILEDNKINTDEEEKVNNYIISTTVNNEENITDILLENENDKEKENEKSSKDRELLFVLEIPKIKLKKGIYYINSKYNKVKYNIQILKESDMPDKKNGNVMLASHRGRSKVAFFENLYKLKTNDIIYIYYNGVKYIYKLNKVYDVKIDGDAEIYRDIEKNTLTLITCKRNVKNKQQVFISYLDSVVYY